MTEGAVDALHVLPRGLSALEGCQEVTSRAEEFESLLLWDTDRLPLDVPCETNEVDHRSKDAVTLLLVDGKAESDKRCPHVY
jgi:hypothetical protein